MIPDVYFNTHTHQVEALLRSLVLYLILCICDLFSLCLHFPFIMFHTCLTPSALLISHSLSLSPRLSHTHTHTLQIRVAQQTYVGWWAYITRPISVEVMAAAVCACVCACVSVLSPGSLFSEPALARPIPSLPYNPVIPKRLDDASSSTPADPVYDFIYPF